MTSATFRALVLSALLAVAAPSLADVAEDAALIDRQPAAMHNADTDGSSQNSLRENRGDSPTDQTLSTLGALALGVLGLLWVRRHTAQL